MKQKSGDGRTVKTVNEPIGHHFLPEFYLKGFTREEMLSVYDRRRNSYSKQHPRTTAKINYFYSIEDEAGGRDPVVERDLSVIEGRAKPIITALDEGAGISPEDRVHLSIFLALLHSRVPKFEREITEIVDQTAKALLKKMMPNEDAVRAHRERMGRHSDVDPAAVVDFVQNERFYMKGHRNHAIDAMLNQWRKLTELFNIMDWTVAHVGARSSFITTDAPFAFLADEQVMRSGAPVLAVGSFEVTKAVPLTQRTCLLLGGKGVKLEHRDFSRVEVREINERLAEECERFLYGTDEDRLRNIVRRSEIDRKRRTGTRMRVDHIPHPTDPSRTYMVSYRVSVDAPNKPLKIAVD
jgi:hypothetical protein